MNPSLPSCGFAGHTLQQVFREKSIAIYARSRPDREPHEFELVVIRDKPAAIMPNGITVPEREAYPSNSEWGRWAWSFPIRERAFVFDLAARMAAMTGPYGAWDFSALPVQSHGFCALCAAVDSEKNHWRGTVKVDNWPKGVHEGRCEVLFLASQIQR